MKKFITYYLYDYLGIHDLIAHENDKLNGQLDDILDSQGKISRESTSLKENQSNFTALSLKSLLILLILLFIFGISFHYYFYGFNAQMLNSLSSEISFDIKQLILLLNSLHSLDVDTFNKVISELHVNIMKSNFTQEQLIRQILNLVEKTTIEHSTNEKMDLKFSDLKCGSGERK